MSKRKKSNSTRPPSALPQNVYQIKNPSRPLKPLLAILDEVCAAVLAAISISGPTAAGFPAFDRAILSRGLNLLEAIRVLAVHLHWEVAASGARQMFELVLNMEALEAMPDREEGSYQYAWFGLLQQTRAQIRELDYERTTGRYVDEERAARLSASLSGSQFDLFRSKPRRDGSAVWWRSWNDKTTRDMAKASPGSLRGDQYDQLFVAWSEEAHAAPGALIDLMFRTAQPGWAEGHLARELRETSQIIAMALRYFFELWSVLVNVPAVDQADWERWFRRIVGFAADSGYASSAQEHGST